jgi:hypothetical protein
MRLQGPARLLVGATFLVAGFGVLSDGAPLRVLDFKDRECRSASVAVGSACPAGCAPRPFAEPSERSRAAECRSRLWIATCGAACEPAPGYVRMPDGRLGDARRLLLELAGPPSAGHERALAEMRAVLEPRFDGMYRYEVALAEDATREELEETKKRLAALPGVRAVEYLPR